MTVDGAKLLIVSLIAVALLLALIRPVAEHGVYADAVVISVSFWGSYEEWKMWQEIVDGFHRDNPDIRVRLNYIPGNYDDKIRLLLAANSAPDIMLLQDEPFPAYAGYGKLEDLTDRVLDPSTPFDWHADFWPTAPESFVCGGRVFGVPIWGGNVLVYYNRTMFRDLGVDPPPDDWDFDAFVAKARELTRDLDGDGRLDTYGFAVPGWVYYLPWTWGFGARYLNEDRTDWAFTGPEAVASLRFCQDLLYKYRVSPSPYDMPNTDLNAMFMTGRVGMVVSGPWNSPPLKTADIDFDVVHIPYGPTGERHTRVTWDCLAMFSGTSHKEEAWRFMAYCLTYEAQAIVGRYIRSVPALRAAKDAFMNPDNDWNEEKYIDALAYARYQPISIRWNQMEQIIAPEYERLLMNKQTPEQTVERLQAAIRRDRIFPLDLEEAP